MLASTGSLILAFVAAFAVLTTVLSLLALLWTTRRHRGPLPDHTPPVTVYKPLKGHDDGLEDNLRSFFTQDYPTYQLIFCVADEDDPAIPVVKKLLVEFPDRDAELIVGTRAYGLNPKVESLATMERHRKHGVVLISDSNVRVRPNYLRETACHLADPGVGLVSNIFVGVGEDSIGAACENLQLNGFIAGGVAIASCLRITCVVGKSMMMPQHVHEAIGGFAGVRNLLAEDQVIGVRVRKAGYSVKLSRHVIENVNVDRGLSWFLNRHSRWFKIRRRLAFPTYIIEPTSNLAAVGIVCALSGEAALAWTGLGLIGLGIARDAFQTWWLRGSPPKPRHLLLSPIKDIILLPVWFDSLVNDRLQWRGHKLVIGRCTRLRAHRVSRDVRRRVRRVRRFRSPNGDC